MNKFKEIDLKTWKRTELFKFYQTFDSPTYNVSLKLNGENIYKFAKEKKESFFLLSLYAITKAANLIPELRQRVMNEKVVQFENLSVMTPIMTEFEMFQQVYNDFRPTFAEFKDEIMPKVQLAKANTPLPLELEAEDFICASCNPWLHFDSISQADYSFFQSVPILAWGKIQDNLIPIACKFDHSFVDGLHTAKFFNAIEDYFKNPEEL